jgi:hypothetical protein
VGSSAPPRWMKSSGTPSQVLGPQPQNSQPRDDCPCKPHTSQCPTRSVAT